MRVQHKHKPNRVITLHRMCVQYQTFVYINAGKHVCGWTLFDFVFPCLRVVGSRYIKFEAYVCIGICGWGFMASSFDIRCPSGDSLLWERRLFPLVNVGAGMCTALGKAMTLLWQVFLVAGPQPSRMRTFLNRIRSITTDLGTERLLANFPDVLPDFFYWIGARLPAAVARRTFLFPRALPTPGWCHINDGLVRRGRHRFYTGSLLWVSWQCLVFNVTCLCLVVSHS